MAQEVRALQSDIHLLVAEAVRIILVFLDSLILLFSILIIRGMQMHREDILNKSFYSPYFDPIQIMLNILLLFLMFIFMARRDVFIRTYYEMRRRHHVDPKRIKKMIRSPEKVHRQT